jgi:creatinine amidohydrolase/Fe(II)-dependent formamide hydrolase-like protein
MSTGKKMNNQLSLAVQMQFLRPAQLEAALRRFPAVYVPIGLIEWHGRHLPVGNDALKAHAILVKCAEEFGGVVYPPVYFPYTKYVRDSASLAPDEDEWKISLLTELFQRIKAMGARVIIGVSGHNIPQQPTWINRALEPVIADGTVAGLGIWEMSLSRGPESDSDHAAKWETSNMLFFYPELVNLAELGTGPLAPGMQPPDGIWGLDPRAHASAQVGQRNVELCAAAIGKKARELLASLPEDQRAFKLPTLVPPHWWCV